MYSSRDSIIFFLFSTKIEDHISGELFASLTVDSNPLPAILYIACSSSSLSMTVLPNIKDEICER